MKVYVDELPKSCGDCKFCKQDCYYYCDILHTKLGYFDKEKDCPLQSLSDHDKQLTEQICDAIREKLNKVERPKNYPELDCDYGFDSCIYAIEDILNEIEQGENK